MSSKTFRSLSDFAGHVIEVQCRCRHVGFVDAGKVYNWFRAHRWPDSLDDCGRHFRCSWCGQRNPARYRPADRYTRLTFPRWCDLDEEAWKRLVRKLRG
jgi:hypothetical protein